MPRGDGTGPAGMGPGTGRAAGYCAGYPVPGFANPVPGGGFFGRGFGRGFRRGRGFGMGFGRGRFWGFGYAPYASVPIQPVQPQPAYPQYTREQEAADLKAEKELIERDLKAIEERLKGLEREK